MGKKADAWPAFGFHFVEVFHACEISSSITSSSFGSLFANWVGTSEIINASDLHGLSALLAASEDG
jgi:hypothetical protein